MDLLVNVLLALDKALITLQMTLDCGPGWGGLNQAYGTIHPIQVLFIQTCPNKKSAWVDSCA